MSVRARWVNLIVAWSGSGFARSGSKLPRIHRPGGHWRVWHIAAAAVLIALAAGVTGAFIGRATKGGKEAAPPSWQALPKAPIAGRISPGAVWTGKEVIIWGGVTRSGKVRDASDGAGYDPTTRTWSAIAPSPSGVQGDGGAGVAWTGDEMVVWASNSPDGPVGAAAYDPATNSWRRLPVGPLGTREGYTSVWTGKELIVIGGSSGDALAKPVGAALNPQTGAWRLLPALNRMSGLMPGPGAVWDGQEVFVMGSVCSGRVPATSCSPTLLAYDPATNALRKIDLTKAPIVKEQQLTLVGWSGTNLIFSTVGVPTNVNSGKTLIVRYDPATGRWRRGTFAPYPTPLGAYTQTAWLGDRYVASDGSSGLQIYSLATDAWQTITPGPSPLNSREGSAIVWTGSQLVAWSGTVYKPFNPTPADGTSLPLKK